MARITTYALDSNISLNDKLVGTDADDNSITKNYSIDSLGDGLISLKNIITGGGTLNTIPLFTPDGQIIDDSIITQAATGQGVTVTGRLDVTSDFSVAGATELYGSLTVDGTLAVDGVATFSDEVECNNNVTVQGIFAADGNSVFSGGVTINDQLIDGEASTGTPGQILSSTGDATLWVDNNVLTSPGGIQFRIVVDEAGNLSTTPL